FFLPLLRHAASRAAARAEIAADSAASRAAGRSALARALLAFSPGDGSAGGIGIASQRVDALLGRRPRFEIPLSMLLATAGALVATRAAAVLDHSGDADAAASSSSAETCVLLVVGLAVAIAATAFVRRPR